MGAVLIRFRTWLKTLRPRFVNWCRHAPRRFANWATASTNREEVFGYIVWFGVAIGVAVPEIWAAADSKNVPWPTISGLTGHLEVEHVWISFIVIGVLIWIASHALIALRQTGSKLQPLDGTGRVTGAGGTTGAVPAAWYFSIAAGLLTIGIVAAHSATKHDKYTFGEILYGLIFFFGAVLPGLFAWRGKLMPFPTLFVTLKNLEKHAHFVTLLLATWLTVLFVHLVFYPWPNLLPDFNRLHTTYVVCHPLAPRKKPLSAEDKLRCARISKADRNQAPGIQIKPSPYAP
jgi:hypothetical protein